MTIALAFGLGIAIGVLLSIAAVLLPEAVYWYRERHHKPDPLTLVPSKPLGENDIYAAVRRLRGG